MNIDIYSHHQVEWWIYNAPSGAEFFMHLSGGRASDPNRDFERLANQNAAFAHSYEMLKRAADAKLLEMRFKNGCLVVTRLGPLRADDIRQTVAITEAEREVLAEVEDDNDEI